jgi:hypothetical protein
VPQTGTTYYLTPTGKDSNNGLSPGAPWLTPNHSVNCGDVIIAEPSNAYLSSSFHRNFGTVTCPAGNNVAWLKCAVFDGCIIISPLGQGGMWIDQSFWGIQGWEVQSPYVSVNGGCFGVSPNPNTLLPVHHIILANNVANGCAGHGIAVSADSAAASADYVAIIGNIVWNAAQGLGQFAGSCYSGINVWEPANTDTLPGTHIFIAGNVSWSNLDPPGCGQMPNGTTSDGEGIIIDTLQHYNYTGQVVVENNILLANGGRGFTITQNQGTPPAPVYILNNTTWSNDDDPHGASTWDKGEIGVQTSGDVTVARNIAVTTAATGTGGYAIWDYYLVGCEPALCPTNTIAGNDGYSPSWSNFGSYQETGFSFGANLTLNPNFVNPVKPGAPSCERYPSVPACMAQVIANFTVTNPSLEGYGYQPPTSAPTYDPLFPQWLCNLTNLPAGLITMGCRTEL